MNYNTSYAKPKKANKNVHDNPLHVLQDGESMVCEIRRHPVGLMGLYIGTGFFILLIVAIYLFGLKVLGYDTARNMQIGAIIVALLSALSLLYLFVEIKVFNGNRWIVTSDSLTQVQQTGLFTRQASQLSLDNLEDITTEQNGLLAQMLDYGVLKAETAGENSKFKFMFCPNPNYYAKLILDAREKLVQKK